MKNALTTFVLCGIVAGAAMAADKTIAEQKAAYEDSSVGGGAILNTPCTAYMIPFGQTVVVGDGVSNTRLWYVWVGTGTGLHLETCFAGTDFDTDIRIFTGDCAGTLTSVFYNDGPSGCDYQTNLQCTAFTFAVGVTYYIRVDRYSNADIALGQSIEMLWEDCAPPPPPPANDVWTGATPMSIGDCVTGSNAAPYTDTTGAYADTTHLNCTWKNANSTFYSNTSSGLGRDVWYSVTVPNGNYTFDLFGSSYDTVIGVWDANHVLVAGNDDWVPYGTKSKIECCYLTAGTYYISVDAYGSATGTYSLCTSSCGSAGTEDQPASFELGKAFPNPFNPSTTINFTMGETANANLTVYNMAGQAVATLVDGVVGAGAQSVVFDASELTSGVYFYTLNVAGQSMTEKMVLVK